MNTESKTSLDAELRIQTICLMSLTGITIVAALYWLRPVLVPFVLSVFLVCGIAPLLDLIQQRLRAPRVVAVAITFLLGIALLAVLWLVVWLSVASLMKDADTYRSRFDELVARISAVIPEAPGGNRASSTSEDDAAPQDASAESQPVPTANHADLQDFTGRYIRLGLTKISSALMDILGSGTMVLIFMFFLLLGGSTETVPRTGIWMEIESKIRSYLVTKTVISVFTGAAFGFVLWLFGIPLAVVFALLACLLNFIPNIGPIIACLLPLPLILLSPDLSFTAMIIVILLSSGIQFFSGNVVEPKIMGDSFQLHPVAILLTLMIWGMLWGIIGMILATPVTAAMKILLERFQRTRPIAELLAGRFDSLRDVAGDVS
ncbi:MAG: AI-2E family transporter [Planctomycetes bacterium]|nr:AI-2E family transporter [Planctomycetota bacterium]